MNTAQLTKSDIVATFERAVVLGHEFALAHPGVFVVCQRRGFTPFRVTDNRIGLLGKEIWCTHWHTTAQELAQRLTSKFFALPNSTKDDAVIALRVEVWIERYAEQVETFKASLGLEVKNGN